MATTPFGTAVGDELYDALAPLAGDDEGLGYPLRAYCRSIGQMFEETSWYSRDDGAAPGWSRLVDLEQTPSKALPWLAQIVGVTLEPGLSDDAQRQRIRDTDGFNRGTIDAIKGAARQYLIGAQTVIVNERDPDPYSLTVITYTAETPDSGIVGAALIAQKPAGLILTYLVHDGQDFAQLLAGHPTFADVASDYATFADVRDDL